MPKLPRPRGPISEQVLTALRGQPGPIDAIRVEAADLGDDDLNLALYASYELHYRGFDEVDDRWEWHPPLLALRGELERAFEELLVEALGSQGGRSVPAEAIDVALREIADTDQGPPVSRYVELEATLDQVREFLIHRSAYQLKEADPHTWAIPRLHGKPKAAIVEVQADEYGDGRAERIHAQLFADAMAALGLDPAYGAYLDRIPGVTLATVNLMSLCGLHRRLLPAIVGHLALFEMTSSVPNRRYGNGIRRLGFAGDAVAFFDEHVVADAVHENIAAVDLAGGLVRQDAALAGGVLWGARALALLDARWAEHVLDAWQDRRSSLLEPTRRAEAGELVGSVAQGADPRLAAPA
jgi:hypothetical protein